MLEQSLSFVRGILALFFRSLRIEARSFRMHLLWFLLMLVIYMSLWMAQQWSQAFGAPGLRFFQYVAYLDAVFITLLGLSFFSTAISEEKEEDTLGLMTMAGIGSLGILLGKSTSRLFQVFLLLAIQFPFTLLAVTMGGLLPVQIFSAYISLLAYTILLANVALLCSVACRTNRNASALTTFWLLGYLFAPLMALAMKGELTYRGWTADGSLRGLVFVVLDWIARSTIFSDLYAVTVTSFEFHFTPQIITNTLGGGISFCLAWLLFGFVSKEPATDSTSRGMVAKSTSGRLRFFSAGRVWDLPLVWKDFFFVAGGWGGIIIRCCLYFGLYGLCISASLSDGSNMEFKHVTYLFQIFAYPLVGIDIALTASRVFHEEIKGQTLSSLLMLPRSIPELVYTKVLGCALALLPGVLSLTLSFVMPGGCDFIKPLTDEPYMFWWLMNLILMIHLTALFSTFLRSGAFALAFGTTIGTMILTGMILGSVAFASGSDVIQGLFLLAALVQAGACAGCHVIILQRIPKLGEK